MYFFVAVMWMALGTIVASICSIIYLMDRDESKTNLLSPFSKDSYAALILIGAVIWPLLAIALAIDLVLSIVQILVGGFSSLHCDIKKIIEGRKSK